MQKNRKPNQISQNTQLTDCLTITNSSLLQKKHRLPTYILITKSKNKPLDNPLTTPRTKTTMLNEHDQKNKFSNYKKMISIADTHWKIAELEKISNLNVTIEKSNQFRDQYNRLFHHFCTTSYLGLDYHPALLRGAIDALKNTGSLRIPNSKNRCKLNILELYEQELSELFSAHGLTTLSCSAASAGVLPLLASGTFTSNIAPLMCFDKSAHYSMNHLKAACADETEVLTCPHNDMNYLEGLCKKHRRVAYIADGVYSMGGVAHIDEIQYLKDRYGMFIYMDDSHSLSATGRHGAGYVRSNLSTLDDQSIIVASLAKSFGASGGVVMFGNNENKQKTLRYGGPSNWSQSLNSAAIGAGRASILLHHTDELNLLQNKLNTNIKLFDSLIKTKQHDSFTAIRLIHCGQAEIATKAASYLADNGFFTAAVFFPVVAKHQSAIRITLRADMPSELIRQFCNLIHTYWQANNLPAPF